MYIPTPRYNLPGSAALGRHAREVDHNDPASNLASVSSLFHSVLSWTSTSSDASLDKRQFSSDQSRNTNIKIGIIVAFLVPAFLGLLCFFLFYYRGSIQCIEARRRRRRHHRHHKSLGSRSSKSSRNSDGPPPPPPPPPEDDAPRAPTPEDK